ncbi:MAG: PQQ-binding-like beta-propeller repeat protein [Bacteriovoracaceae bacterium]|nr:PQQ-binding-like beta-propeller repeat protein [Bacteriovoracaceae bacterium]
MRSFFFSFLVFILACSSCSQFTLKKNLTVTKEVFQPSYIENIDPFYRPGNLPIGYATPLMDDDGIYFGTPNGEIKKYVYSLKRSLVLAKERYPVFGRPFIQDGILYYGTQGAEIVAWNVNKKEEVFRTKVSAPSESTIVLSQGRLLTSLRNHGLVALDAKTGKTLWFYKRAVPSLTTLQRVAVPVVIGSKIFQGFADGTLSAIRLEDGTLSWEQKISVPAKFQDIDFSVVPQGKYLWVSATNQAVKLIYQENGLIQRSFEVRPTTNLVAINDNTVVVGTSGGSIQMLSSQKQEIKEIKISKQPLSSIALLEEKRLLIADFAGKVQLLNNVETDNNVAPHQQFLMGSQWSSLLGDIEVKGKNFSFISSRNRLYVFE